jgi:hypothetical protein
MATALLWRTVARAAVSVALVSALGCRNGDFKTSGEDDQFVPVQDAGAQPISIPNTCGPGKLPSLRGVVYAPNGLDPVGRALVYIARDEPEPLPAQNDCELCKILSSGVWVQTHSDAKGAFRFTAVPAGTLRLVVQLGRFRRITTIEASCNSEIVLDAAQTRLPRNRKEGDIPNVAVSTGQVDRMQDVLTKIGLEQFDLIEGRGASSSTPYPTLAALLGDPVKLGSYHILLLNCSNGFESLLQSSATVKNVQDFVHAGGRLFVDDLSYEFIQWPFPDAISFESLDGHDALDAAELGKPLASVTASITQPELRSWLELFPGMLQSDGTVSIQGWLGHWAVMHAPGAGSKVWVQGDVSFYPSSTGSRPLTVSADPVRSDGRRCGRVAFNSYHTVPNQSSPTSPFLPQERILEYIFFRVADCLTLE